MNKTFGQRLRAARNAKNLSRKELAAQIHYSQHTIKAWELDRHIPSKHIIKTLEKTLDTPLTPIDPALRNRTDKAFFDLKTKIISLPEEQQAAAIRAIEFLAKSYR